MTETIRYSLIGKEDLALGAGETKFEVTLADGRVVLMSRIDLAAILSNSILSSVLALQQYTEAELPTAGTAGRIAWVTDGDVGVYYDNGTSWEALNVSAVVAATVQEADGTPSVSQATTIQFDQNTGLVVTNPSGSIAKI